MKKYDLLYKLINDALEGNTAATFELILHFEPLINKYSKIDGRFDQECKDYIIDRLFKKINNFRKN